MANLEHDTMMDVHNTYQEGRWTYGRWETKIIVV